MMTVTMEDVADSTLAFRDLKPDDILGALENLGFQCDGRFLALNSYENRVYQVGIEDNEPVVAKFYRPGRWSDDAILEEHAFTLELANHDIPVVAPLTIDNRTLHHCGPFRIAVAPRRGGRAPDLDNNDLQRQLGRLVARIHLAGQSAEFKHRPTIDIESYGYESIDFLLHNDFIPNDLIKSYEAISNLVCDGAASCFERSGDVQRIRLHGDFHPGNVLVAGDALHIVDLDDARSGPSIQDLWMFLSGNRQEQTPQLQVLLDGYGEFRRVDTL
jgi:Ser/Thr protein kinase RdoA (MazF antagonist)